MRKIELTVYKFDELNADAKERARAWWRDGAFADEWWGATYEDAEQCAAVLGIEIATREKRGLSIFFTGFSSQGDGASFEGCYQYAKGGARGIRQHAPKDEELHRIADALQNLQAKADYRIRATSKVDGHYSHSGCMSVDVYRDDGGDVTEETSEGVTKCLRDFADWIYRQLEREYEYQNADAQVDEAILANEYEFYEDGTRAA